MCWQREKPRGMLSSQGDLERLVGEWGFLPLLKNWVPCFSVEEHTPPELWFRRWGGRPLGVEGPGDTEHRLRLREVFRGQGGVSSPRSGTRTSPTTRRDGYDFDARYDDGLARNLDKRVYDVLLEHQPLLSKEWRKLTGIEKRGEFDGRGHPAANAGVRGHHKLRVRHRQEREPYGWGLARYATPEATFGEAFGGNVYQRSPEESRQRVERHLRSLLPQATARQLKWIMG